MAAATKGEMMCVAFPKIRTRQDLMFDDTLNSASNLGVSLEKVHLSDLNWKGPLVGLRLLFAKINATQGTVRPMPAPPLPKANRVRARQTQAMTSMLDASSSSRTKRPPTAGMILDSML